MSKKGKNRSKKKIFSLKKENKKTISYWLLSLFESARIEGSFERNRSNNIEISLSELRNGAVDISVVSAFQARNSNDNSRSDIKFPIPVLISPIRLSPRYDKRNYVLEPFKVPARLESDGRLLAPELGMPYFGVEFLEPNHGAHVPLTLGTVLDSKKFFKKKVETFSKFNQYFKYCEKYFHFVTGFDLDDVEIDDWNLLSSSSIALSVDVVRVVGAQGRLLEEVLAGTRNPGALETLSSLGPRKRSVYARSRYASFSLSRRHGGHFSRRHSLSLSQRQAVHRFLETKDGGVLPVAGPPGTGKTTVLQSFIASSWVLAAIKKQPLAPIQVVCGATNQSVLNVINSMEISSEKNEKGRSGFEQRWIPGIHSYGTFCASFSKAKESEAYQLEQTDGAGFSSEMETGEFYGAAENYYLQCFATNIKKVTTVKKAVDYLHQLLKKEESDLAAKLSSRLKVSISDMLFSVFSTPSEVETASYLEILSSEDTISRYKMFMLATHYWEGRWLLETYAELKKRARSRDMRLRFRPTPNDWGRRAMLTPVFVSTLNTSCRFFTCSENKSGPSIDVLYFDEAGQVPPEQAAPIAVLAKKIVAIGDIQQLEPYAIIPKHQDVINLIDQGLLPKSPSDADFNKLLDTGVTSSGSNLMQRATACCQHEDGRIIGAMLSEHRRSVPAIVSFCNELSYRGRLNAARKEPIQRVLPAFGFCKIDSSDVKHGRSRKNPPEARNVLAFILQHHDDICRHYGVSDISSVLAVITPFTAQVTELERSLRSRFPDMIIGTVHSLQGAEREIVVFSSVYGFEENQQRFFDLDPRMLNVAVSRAKDSFVLFGNEKVFDPTSVDGKPSSILARHIAACPGSDLVLDLRSGAGVELGSAASDGSVLEKTRISTLEDHKEVLRVAFLTAKRRILIASPTISIHALESDDLKSYISKSIARGVDVVVFTDYDLDMKDGVLKTTADQGRKYLIDAGAKVIVANSFHNKSLAIDDTCLIEGSFNWLSAVRTLGSRFQKHETSSITQGGDVGELISSLEQEMYGRMRHAVG